MRFENGRSIYEQIVEYIENQVLAGTWQPDDRIPSVRELAVELGSNSNTVQRSFALLQDEGAIYNQRGVGYFVSPDAPDRTRASPAASL
jgi:GntR family transcriptional regulator